MIENPNPTPPTIPSVSEDSAFVNPTPFYRRKITLLIVVFLLSVGIAAGMLYLFKQQQGTKSISKNSVAPTLANEKTIPAAQFLAKKYTFSGSIPASPSLSTYSLKSSYSPSEVTHFAAQLGLDEASTVDNDNNIYVTSENPETRGFMVFNTKSGSFMYQSYGAFTSPAYKNQSLPQESVALLTDLGMYDPTITCDITYKNKLTPNITYVECHRMWTTLNAPLLNLGGTLNIPENVLIGSLTPGKATEIVSSADPEIIDVSNGGNGLGRPNQFNTITIGFADQGRVHSIHSTMRKIENSTPVNSSELISASEALELFKKGGGTLSLTVPTGSGNVDWNKIYPHNTAHSEDATITEITPAYLDKPLKNEQTSYEPYYLIRGTARLTSGYTVQFTQSIPALKSRLASTTQRISEEDSLQLQTFTIPPADPTATTNPNIPTTTPISEPTVIPTITDLPIITPSLTPQVVRNDLPPVCHVLDARGEEIFTVNVEGYGQLNIGYYPRGNYHTFNFVTDRVITSPQELSTMRNHLFTALEDQFVILSARSMLSKNYNPFGSPSQKIYTEDKNSPINFSRVLLPSTAQYGGGTITDDFPESIVVNNNIRAKIDAIKNNRKLLSETALKPNLFPSIYLSEINTGLIYMFDTSFLYNSTPLPADFVPVSGQQVSCYISGFSPHIFVYKKGSEIISINAPTNTIFSDPATDSHIWSVKTNDRSEIKTLDGKMRSSLYYEYDPTDVKFTESSKGYIVDREKIKDVISNIGMKLGLTKDETDALYSDTQNTLTNLLDTKYVKVSVINPEELDKQLPLNISPKPTTIARFHLMLSSVTTPYVIQEPKIEKIVRSDYSVVELGAATSR